MRHRKKNILAVFLALAMTIGAFSLPIHATQTPSLTISSAEVKAGGDVTLTVSIQDNPGIAAAMIYVYYDTESFEVALDDGVATQGQFKSSGGLLVNSISVARQNGRYNGVAGKDGILALWYSGKGTNVNGDGAFLTITLHAKSGAANGAHTIQLGYSPDDSCNEKGEAVVLSAGSATVTVTGGDDQKQPQTPTDTPDFSDIAGNWAEEAIEDAAELGLVKGHLGNYRPDDTMTRAEFVTILWRACGEPAPAGKASFADLTQSWYLDAVAWAEQSGVVNGIGNGRFDPDGNVTREQLVTILHRLAGEPLGMELMLYSVYDSQYSDSNRIGTWAKSALYWAIYEGVYCGENSEEIGTALAPKAAATRAQIAVMMTRYLEKQN